MDILIHLLLIVIIGVFFFLDKYSSSFNPMFFVIILSIMGFIFLQSGDIEYINYSVVEKVNSSVYQYETINLNNIGVGIFTGQSFILLIYWFTLILGSINLILGKKESLKRE